MRDQNYATVPEFQPWPAHDPGWFLLEWDVALDSVSRDRFAARALEHPDRALVAPYLLFPGDRAPQQCHRWHGVPVPVGQPVADAAGFGCIYFPQQLLVEFWNDPPRPFTRDGLLTDTVFSEWHRGRGWTFDIDWTVHPQHLHGD
jgi:hypothetical protein